MCHTSDTTVGSVAVPCSLRAFMRWKVDGRRDVQYPSSASVNGMKEDICDLDCAKPQARRLPGRVGLRVGGSAPSKDSKREATASANLNLSENHFFFTSLIYNRSFLIKLVTEPCVAVRSLRSTS
jgi:hypothetical protein